MGAETHRLPHAKGWGGPACPTVCDVMCGVMWCPTLSDVQQWLHTLMLCVWCGMVSSGSKLCAVSRVAGCRRHRVAHCQNKSMLHPSCMCRSCSRVCRRRLECVVTLTSFGPSPPQNSLVDTTWSLLFHPSSYMTNIHTKSCKARRACCIQGHGMGHGGATCEVG